MSMKLKLGATQLRVLTTLYGQDCTLELLEDLYPEVPTANMKTLLHALELKGFVRPISKEVWGITESGIDRIDNGHIPSSDLIVEASKAPITSDEAPTTTNAIDAVAELIAENERLRSIIETIKSAATI